jgi:hypothetical protein
MREVAAPRVPHIDSPFEDEKGMRPEEISSIPQLPPQL